MRRIRNRKGSYILEASIVMPLFILGMIMLISIIPVISTCENISYGVTEEMRLEMAKSAFRENAAAGPIASAVRVKGENKNVSSFIVTGYRYKYSSAGTKDLVKLSFRSRIDVPDPLGVFRKVTFRGAVVGRTFTGAYYSGEGADGAGDGGKVLIFPSWGNRYHNSSCTYVKSSCHLETLSQELKSKYHACPLCEAKGAHVGSSVFVFEYGRAYHLSGCSSVDKYYIETTKSEAGSCGYGPCSKCGG